MMDWSASILKIADAKPPKDRPLDGIDLLPILEGKQGIQERALFWRRVGPDFVKTHRAVRQGNWKYIDEPNGAQYLYDLSNDIAEKNNLAADQKMRSAEMKQLIIQWESRVDPPLYPVQPSDGKKSD